MDKKERQKIIETIVKRQKLKQLNRLQRLFRDPFRAFPFYLIAILGHIKPFKIRFSTLWNTKMVSYLPEGNTFYYYGYCEADLTSFLLRFLQPGMNFVDIGAHVGYYTMLASALGGHVYSFEPTPWTFALLKENSAKLNNVHIENVALSDKIGKLTFADYGPGYGAYNTASKEGAFIKRSSNMTTVPTTTFDEYNKAKLIKPDMIKIDAEGLEFNILKGMTTTISKDRPVISLELANDAAWGDNHKQSREFLEKLSYQAFEMSVDGSISEHGSRINYGYANILFIPKEKVAWVRNLLK